MHENAIHRVRTQHMDGLLSRSLSIAGSQLQTRPATNIKLLKSSARRAFPSNQRQLYVRTQSAVEVVADDSLRVASELGDVAFLASQVGVKIGELTDNLDRGKAL